MPGTTMWAKVQLPKMLASVGRAPKPAYQAPIIVMALVVMALVMARSQLGCQIGDAIEPGCNSQHLLPRPGIAYRFRKGANLLSMAEPELGIV